MKMRNLLFGVFLGLLAVVRSTPVVPLDDLEGDFNRKAETEDFLADEYLLPSLTTESPKRNVTVPATQQPMSESKESDMTDGSGGELTANDATTTLTSTTTVLPDDANRVPQSGATSPSEPDEALSTDNDAIEDTTVMSTTPMFFPHEDEHYKSTTPSVPHAQSSTSTPFPMPSDDFNSHSSTTRAPQSGATSPSEPDDALSTDDDVIEDTTVKSTTPMFFQHEDEHYKSTTSSVPHAQSSTSTPFPMLADGSGSGSDPEDGSGMMELPGILSITTRPSTTSTSTAETSTTSSTSEPGLVQEDMIEVKQNIQVQSENRGQVQKNTQHGTSDSPTNAGHSTPAWIIIVGFIAAVAALVMLCVAIATRDKWNGPRQASQAKANPSNQQRELEMETFLHKDNPRENGTAAEYTVIPLDELPEKYSSH